MPETPTPSPDRHALPIAWESTPGDPFVDVDFLVCDGLLSRDVDYMSQPREALERLLDELGQRGCYETHVRANGMVYQCPSWCVGDHPRAEICEDEDNPPVHIATLTPVHLAAGQVVDVDVYAAEEHPQIAVGTQLALTNADDARALAAALLNAADVLDAVTA